LDGKCEASLREIDAVLATLDQPSASPKKKG
jgi:hypothetical protein